MNKVILIGNTGNEAEIRTLESGVKVANFSLATSENYTKKDGTKVQDTTWHKIEVWNGIASVIESYIRKGDRLMVEGKIVNQKYIDKEGIERSITKIRAERIELLGVRREKIEEETEEEAQQELQQELAPKKAKKSKVVLINEDDLPF